MIGLLVDNSALNAAMNPRDADGCVVIGLQRR
jgi:hypothetical protein